MSKAFRKEWLGRRWFGRSPSLRISWRIWLRHPLRSLRAKRVFGQTYRAEMAKERQIP